MYLRMCLALISIFLVFPVITAENIINTGYSVNARASGSNFSKAVVEVIRQYFAKATPTVYILRSSINSKSYRVQGDLVNEILQGAQWLDTAFVLEGYIHLRATDRRFFNIFIVDGYYSFRFIKFRMTNKNFNYRGFYYIVYTGQQRSYYEEITKIFQDLYHMYIVNVNVLVNIGGEIMVYTYFPFTRFHCNVVVPTLYNRFDGIKFQHDRMIFPRKTYNFHQCPLTVVTWQTQPLVMIKDIGNGSHEFSGIDGLILSLLSERLNFKLVLKMPPEEYLRGTIFPNGTSTGAFKMVQHTRDTQQLMDNEGNLTINDFGLTVTRKQFLSPSISYRHGSLAIAIPPGAPYTSLEKLTFPFNGTVWFCIGGTLVLGFLVILILKLVGNIRAIKFIVGQRNETPVLNMLDVFLGGSLKALPRRNFARSILGMWMLFSLVLRNAYQAELFRFLQSSMTKDPIEDIDEMIRLNYTFYSEGSIPQLLDPQNPLRNLLKPINASYDEYFKMLQQPNARKAVVCNEPVLVSFNVRNYKSGFIYQTSERLFRNPIVIFLRKHSFFKEPIDSELELYITSGLIEYFHKKYLDYEFLDDEDNPDEPHIIKVEHLIGILKVCGAMILLSFVIFVLEILSTRLRGLMILRACAKAF